MIDTVAVAVEEQSVTTKKISENVSQAALGIQEITENVAKVLTSHIWATFYLNTSFIN